jgi:hypothetical protein
VSRFHSKEKIYKLRQLRRNGSSIEDIVRRLSIPKTTVWHHIQGIELSDEHRARLRANQGGSKLKKQRDLAKARAEARDIYKGPTGHLCSLIAMLYWAEGNKDRCVFTNTDPNMISAYINIMTKGFGIEPDRVSLIVRYFTGMDEGDCIRYWSKVTGRSVKSIKTYFNDGGKRGKSAFGICRVTIRRGAYQLKLLNELIKLASDDLKAPVVQRIRTGPS